MTLPLYQNGGFDYSTGMAIAVVLGFFFGFALERGGFSRATILAAQFYGRNNRVFKVMFTAIVTATVGLGVLSGFGLVDVSLVDVPATNFLPLAVGGFLLGVGFIVSGYCPGTAVVGMASGSRDAAMSLVGMVIGSLVFAFSWEWIEVFYVGNDQGALRLTDTLGASWPVVAALVLLIALGGFWGAEALERHLAKKDKLAPPDADPRPKRRVFAVIGVAAAIGLTSLLLPAERAVAQEQKVSKLDPVQLAQDLIQNPRAYWVVDLRAASSCAKARVPGALCRSADDPKAGFIRELPAVRTLVLYGQGADPQLPDSVREYAGQVVVLAGGYQAFEKQLLKEPKAPKNPTTEQFESYQLRFAMYQQLSGAAAKAPAKRAPPKAVKRAARKGGGC